MDVLSAKVDKYQHVFTHPLQVISEVCICSFSMQQTLCFQLLFYHFTAEAVE